MNWEIGIDIKTWFLKLCSLQSTRAFYRNVGKCDTKSGGLLSTGKLFPGPGFLEGLTSARTWLASVSIRVPDVVCPPGR